MFALTSWQRGWQNLDSHEHKSHQVTEYVGLFEQIYGHTATSRFTVVKCAIARIPSDLAASGLFGTTTSYIFPHRCQSVTVTDTFNVIQVNFLALAFDDPFLKYNFATYAQSAASLLE